VKGGHHFISLGLSHRNRRGKWISAAINAMPSAAPHFFEVKMKAPPRL
jgi:hypothetical protein